MAKVTKDQVKKIADVARLDINEEETEVLVQQLSDMLSYADVLKDLDTEGVEPLYQVHEHTNVLRKDEPRQWITQDEALKNATIKKDGQFQVPSILE
ncbi:MAG TPA: Asp-tRNA(Asn)/Glu-tRNA(Gln) amidotransferase subunit GatC [Bacilli bacterium]|nr:Asp-tRNA(Asn)/Glu-tRNA(Gln) amidotransferase subunit GatC [Bacilli bacterium]